jgi:hypothetical protein
MAGRLESAIAVLWKSGLALSGGRILSALIPGEMVMAKSYKGECFCGAVHIEALVVGQFEINNSVSLLAGGKQAAILALGPQNAGNAPATRSSSPNS